MSDIWNELDPDDPLAPQAPYTLSFGPQGSPPPPPLAFSAPQELGAALASPAVDFGSQVQLAPSYDDDLAFHKLDVNATAAGIDVMGALSQLEPPPDYDHFKWERAGKFDQHVADGPRDGQRLSDLVFADRKADYDSRGPWDPQTDKIETLEALKEKRRAQDIEAQRIEAAVQAKLKHAEDGFLAKAAKVTDPSALAALRAVFERRVDADMGLKPSEREPRKEAFRQASGQVFFDRLPVEGKRAVIAAAQSGDDTVLGRRPTAELIGLSEDVEQEARRELIRVSREKVTTAQQLFTGLRDGIQQGVAGWSQIRDAANGVLAGFPPRCRSCRTATAPSRRRPPRRRRRSSAMPAAARSTRRISASPSTRSSPAG